MNHTVLTLRNRGGRKGASTSRTSTPQSSAHGSVYPSEDDEAVVGSRKPFRLLDLPTELRLKIYDLLFHGVPDVIDLDPDNFRNIHRNLAVFYVCKQIHAEASHTLYSSKTFRIFPCYPGRFFKSKRPLLARLSPRCRACMTSMELRLGPGFANPPAGWVVNDALGLADAVNVRMLKVMVQVDTSHPMYNGFRAKCADDAFYENFSKDLLDKVLLAVTSIVEVQFDAFPSIQKDGAMMKALLDVTNRHKKVISYGPESGWDKEKGTEYVDTVLASTTMIRPLPEVAVFS